MQTLQQIKQILESRGLSPKKSLGQNFLIDHNLIRKLVDASRIGPGDLVLEVGPGTGTMTEELLARGAEVVACELDDHLADMLAERARSIEGGERLTVVHADCLEKAAGEKRLNPQVRGILHHRPFVLVSNLPYGAGTPLLTALLLHHPECARMAVTVQREVADRLLAPPGSRDRGGVSVIAQALCTVSRVATAPPECFWPRPEVTSTMVLLERRAEPLTADPVALSEFCRRLFASRRKQLGAILGRATPWPPGIDPAMRPEALTVEQIEALRLAVAGGQAGTDRGGDPLDSQEPAR
jgi:16S rRNA (adenine1518-N6/adenine1519-N6)-dimethyltransferase